MPYGTLAAVYDFLTPEELLTPDGCAAACLPALDGLAPGARVLDCACGPGTLAVGLALRGFAVEASDVSPQMIARTRALAARHGVDVPARVCAWESLGEDAFAAVLCVGNSLTHAPDRSAALARMAAALRPGGLLVLTSRNWERERAAGSRLEVEERLVERGGRRALIARAWTIPDAWDAPHALEVAVAVLEEAGAVAPAIERLAFWPFTHERLLSDLQAAGLKPLASTYAPDAGHYLTTARTSLA